MAATIRRRADEGIECVQQDRRCAQVHSIAARPCFLCPENLYPEQLALPFSADWLVLNNPFPIFRDHLVVSSAAHADQLLESALPAMVDFVAALEGSFSAFYNGARCGASAPDHLHFQACPAGMLSLEEQLTLLMKKSAGAHWHFTTLDNRGIGLCRAASASELLEHLLSMCTHLNRSAEPGQEADLNLIIFSRPGFLKWRAAGVCCRMRLTTRGSWG